MAFPVTVQTSRSSSHINPLAGLIILSNILLVFVSLLLLKLAHLIFQLHDGPLNFVVFAHQRYPAVWSKHHIYSFGNDFLNSHYSQCCISYYLDIVCFSTSYLTNRYNFNEKWSLCIKWNVVYGVRLQRLQFNPLTSSALQWIWLCLLYELHEEDSLWLQLPEFSSSSKLIILPLPVEILYLFPVGVRDINWTTVLQ